MEQEQLTKIKDKLRKLMNHEESARKIGNIDEANVFASKISNLLLEYQIEVHEMESHSLGKAEGVGEERVDTDELATRHESNWVVHLYHQIALNNFCKVIITNKQKGTIMLCGEPMNREVVHYIVAQLVNKFRYLAREEFKRYNGLEKRNTYIRGFLRGAAAGVGQKMREERLKNEQAQQQQGIVLAQKGKLDTWVDNNYSRLGHTKSRHGKGSDGRSSGVIAGRNVNINKGVSGNSGRTHKLS